MSKKNHDISKAETTRSRNRLQLFVSTSTNTGDN
jgi:hypothetical protein